MLKETEETISLLLHFYHWWLFNWGGGLAPAPPPPGCAYATFIETEKWFGNRKTAFFLGICVLNLCRAAMRLFFGDYLT